MKIKSVMNALSNEREVFHSEADFQHSLGWKLKELYPKAKIRLEVKQIYPVEESKTARRRSLDLMAVLGKKRYLIELKYKTAEINGFKPYLSMNKEEYQTPREGAQDLSRYGFLADIERLEDVVLNNPLHIGYAIFLTNDHLYWTAPRRDTKDKMFRIHDGTIEGRKKWLYNPAKSTRKGRGPISIKGRYPIQWEQYSTVENTTFQYLAVKII